MLKIFNWAYNSADTLIVIGRDMQDVVAKKISDPSKMVFVPNWSDINLVTPIPKKDNPILNRLGVTDRFVFSVAGNMGRTQGLDNVITALTQQSLASNTVFLFMGGGARLEKLREDVKKKGLDNVIITGWIPEEEQNAMLGACDVAVISLAEGMYGLSVPSKSYFNMAAGKPLLLIADAESEIARVIREYKIGWVVPPNRPDELARMLDEVQKTSAEELSQYGARARLVAENVFSEEIVLKQYQTVICRTWKDKE